MIWQILGAILVLVLAIGTIRVAFFKNSNDGFADLLMSWLLIDLAIDLFELFIELVAEILSNL